MILPDKNLQRVMDMIIAFRGQSDPISGFLTQKVGNWAAGQLLGSAAAGGPLGMLVGGLVGSALGGLFKGMFKRGSAPKPEVRQVVAQSPYEVLASELPKMQAEMANMLQSELMARVSQAFGGNKLLASSAKDNVLQSFAQMVPQLQQQRMQSLLNLTEMALQDRISKRQIAGSLLGDQLRIQGQMALQRQQNQNALTSTLLAMVLQQAMGGLGGGNRS